MIKRSSTAQRLSEPIDRVAIIVIAILSVLIGLLLLSSGHTAPRIRDFSWQGKQIGAEDTAFLLTFSRPMNHASVENNLRIEPPLAGKFSWAGRRMAYTLTSPAPYGTDFQVKLQGARDRFSEPTDTKAQIQPFTETFQTRDRAFVYLGVEKEEAGRLVFYNLTRQTKQLLTPANLVVMDFEPYPNGDRILFAASDRTAQAQGMLDQRLYTVTTGIQVKSPAEPPLANQNTASPVASTSPQPAGVIEEILDSKDYQNLKFDLSPDGQIIIVQRVNRTDPADFGLWQIKPNQPPQPLKTEPGGDFLITPDSQALAMAQGQGMAILPLESGANPLDFLPKFGMTLSFARDGSAASMVQFNADPGNPTRSLFVVTNQGTDKELLQTNGSILNAQFDPTNRVLYCLITTRLEGDDYLEQPYLSAVNLETAKRTDLLKLPIQRDIQMSLAPDGLGILFDQVITANPEQSSDSGLQSQDGGAIATSAVSQLNFRVDRSEFTSSIIDLHLPINTPLSVVNIS
ncbi:MAG: hypothetical protein SFY66_25075 [Oculatellaceae cyanobacterium bins.114]|nr:hypothetical protein [Oculatellaceae cyanobacterium bins.114]